MSEQSDILDYITSFRDNALNCEQRKLTREEIQQLINNRNHSSQDDWSNVTVLVSHTSDKTLSFNCNKIYNCIFNGTVVLGSFEDDIEYNGKIYHSSLCNSIIEDSILLGNSYIMNNSYIHQTIIGKGCIVFNNKYITGQENCTFGNGTVINIGNELDGLKLPIYNEMNYNSIVDLFFKYEQLLFDSERYQYEKERILNKKENYLTLLDQYINHIRSSFSYIMDHSIIINNTSLKGVCILNDSKILESHMENSTILSNSKEITIVSDSSYIYNSILQWGSKVKMMAYVNESLLLEHSCVCESSKVENVVLCGNSTIGRGECECSFIGPFTNMHHESLSITIIPFGSVNISYGSKVGSNHTSRYPNQVGLVGEGVFIGLDVNIKYPFNSIEAPYTIICAASTLLPQRLQMPFSLINLPSISHHLLSPAYNEIYPGWSIYAGTFTLLRNEDKLIHRDHTLRSFVEKKILRSSIINLLIKSRKILNSLSTQKCTCFTKFKEAIYTEKDCAELGKNYMTEKSRLRGIQAYSFYIQYYYLHTMVNILIHYAEQKSEHEYNYNNISITDLNIDEEWNELVLKVNEEGLNMKTVKDVYITYIKYMTQFITSCEYSLKKDEDRGRKIQPNYDDTHPSYIENKLISEFKQKIEDEKLYLLQEENESAFVDYSDAMLTRLTL